MMGNRKCQKLAHNLLLNFPSPTGNQHRDFQTFQQMHEIIYALYKERDKGMGEQQMKEDLLFELLEKQRGYMEEMLYGD